jgi:hypothetical protein
MSSEVMVKASDGLADDQFGTSVSISGDYAIVGAFGKDVNSNLSAGGAYISERNTGTGVWSEAATGILLASDGIAGDVFGNTVCISGLKKEDSGWQKPPLSHKKCTMIDANKHASMQKAANASCEYTSVIGTTKAPTNRTSIKET